MTEQTSSPVELTPSDHTYLHLDTKSSPMHWAMMLELSTDEPPITFDAIRSRVHERVSRYDLFRLVIAQGRWRKPQVSVADDIEIDRHVSAVDYDDSADLHHHVSTLLEAALPRTNPLWHITFFTPRADGAQFVLLRVHHSLSDGIAGAAFAALLVDGTAEDLDTFDRFATSPRFRTGDIDADVLKAAKTVFGEQFSAGSKGRGWPKLTKSGRRDYHLYSTSTRELRRTAKRNGASVHEFLLAAIGRTLAIAPPPGVAPDVIRVTLPVTNDPAFRHTGNAVVVALLNLAGNEPDLARQIERSRSELAIIDADKPELATAAPAADSPLPWALQRVIATAAMSHMSPDIHIGINPGFTRVRSVLGSKITDLTALSPLAGYSFSVTCLILGNRTSLGIVTDPGALPDGYAATFAETLDRVLQEETVHA